MDSPALASTTHGAPTVLDLIEAEYQRRGSASRGDLEAIAHKYGIEGHEFTSELRRLRKQQYISKPYEIVSGVYTARPAHIYAPGSLDSETLERWQLQINAEHLFLSAKEQRKAGERYARGLLHRARYEGASWFGRMTQAKRLGNVRIADGLKADLIVEYAFEGAHFSELLVEVKNVREYYDISSDVFPKLMQSALNTNRLPVLMVAHISSRAASFCEDAGIALLHFGRRIVERKRRKEARRIFGARSDEEFQFVRLRRIFTEPISPDIRRHVSHVGQLDWLANANLRWYENRHRIERIIELMDAGQWRLAAREIALDTPADGL